MRGRARPPSSPESEESWIVDCPCGCNYDDGDEMVDCDECGVWVHTLCCNILKGHTSYVCDKCKFKRKESEESEVAQLLVELPSKTPPLEEKVFTLRTEFSREERAHVHGIPGGDPSFFVGVSPVFSRQLWIHTGYVPKVFQYKYNDLPEEKAGPCILFGDYAEKKAESPDLECTKSDYPTEPLNIDVPPIGESNADKFYISQDRHSKRDPRKESKHKHRLQQEDGMKNPYHSKRRRDETSKKDFTSKKRSKKYTAEDYQGASRKGFDETTVPLKSSRIASRNLKAFTTYNSVEDADGCTGAVYNSSLKVDEMGRHGTHSLGFYSEEDGSALETLVRKPIVSKAVRKITTVGGNLSEREGSNGTRRLMDNASHQEMHFVRREQKGAARNKNDTSFIGDASKAKDQFSVSGLMDGKGGLVGCSHNALADPRETLQRVRLNVLATCTKDQVDEITNDQFSLSPANEKASQPGKHHINEDASFTSKQQSLSQKHSELGSLPMSKQPICEGHEMYASDDDEYPLSVRVTNELHVEDSLYVSIDQPEDRLSHDELDREKRQDLAPLTPSSPVQQASPQDTNAASLVATSVSGGAIGNLHLVVDESIKSSPRSVQTGPSRSVEMPSPTLSGPGVDSRQQVFMKVGSISPTSERTLNTGLAPSIPSSKASMVLPVISNNRAHPSLVSKSGSTTGNLHLKNNSSSKHRSRTHDARKTDAMAEDFSETLTNLSSQKEFKEPSKSSESKETGIGKSQASKTVLAKAQPSHASALKHTGQLPSIVDSGGQVNTQEQSVLQSRHPLKPMPTSAPHKPERGLVAGSKTTTVLLSPSHLDLHTQAMDSTRPALNDEELALLLHQELNSSPRVARVARVRQSVTAPHPFSIKRPAMGATPVPSIAIQKDPHLIFRRRNRDEAHGKTDDASKIDVSGGWVKQELGSVSHSGSRKEKDMTDASKAQALPSAMIATELNRHLSPGAMDHQLHSDSLGATDADDAERRSSTENILTLPGLIEEILNEKGPNVSYDDICEEVLPHWSKLRKHNGERYAYSSHRQAVLDCLRNRSAWSHLIDRGPKTNLGRKRRRSESAGAMELEHGEHFSHFPDGGEDYTPGKPQKEELDGSDHWPLSDSNKDADLSLPEEVPKGKRKARRGRRLTTESQGYAARGRHGGESVQGVEDDLDHAVSPFSEEPASSSEDEIFVHRSASRHVNRHCGSSIDSEDEDDDADL